MKHSKKQPRKNAKKELPPDVAARRALIVEIIENQIRERNPPETRKTLQRLIADGYSRDEAMDLIGCVVGTEIFNVLKNQQPYNESRYLAGLKALPQLPWDDEE